MADELRAPYGEPSLGYDHYGENGDEPQDFYAGWSLGFGCRVTFGYIDGQLCASVSVSDQDLRNGGTVCVITREQLNAFAAALRQVVRRGGTNEAWWTDDDERTYKVRVIGVETTATIKLDDGETHEVALSELRPVVTGKTVAAHTHTENCMCVMVPTAVEGASECHYCGVHGQYGKPCGSRCDIARDEVTAHG